VNAKKTEQKLNNAHQGQNKKAKDVQPNQLFIFYQLGILKNGVAHDEIENHPHQIPNVSIQKLGITDKNYRKYKPDGKTQKAYEFEFQGIFKRNEINKGKKKRGQITGSDVESTQIEIEKNIE
jgi:hypothetical protein